MGWVILALIGFGTFGLLWRIGVARDVWAFVGAALMLGATGYAVQGRPLQPGRPVKADSQPILVSPDLIALRESMVGRFRADTAYINAADGMTRIGDTQSAVRAVLGGVRKYPDSMALWTALGTVLAQHDGVQVSPAALFAFTQAARLAPRHPAPPFFAGLAYVRAGEFAKARGYWARALALCPPTISYRPAIEQRLALIDRLLEAEAITR